MEEQYIWDIIDKYFTQSGDADCCNILVSHQIQSMNEFFNKKIIEIIQGFNPIVICNQYSPEHKDFKHKIIMNILQPSIGIPMFQQMDGSQVVMTPHLARMHNLTYSGNLHVDIHVTTETQNEDGIIERKEDKFTNVCIGKIPIMVRSKACVLTQMPALVDENCKYECRYDHGGYFIVNGNEKVVISQDRISENKTLVFEPNGNSDCLYAEIRSMPDGIFLPPKTVSLTMSNKVTHLGNVIRLNASFLRMDIPLFVMFRALGIESDKDIFSYIVLDINDPINSRMLSKLAACAEDACDIHTQNDALVYLLKYLGNTGTPKEYLEQPQKALEIILQTIKQDFLSHTGVSLKKKGLYLGYMVRKLMSIHLGYQDYDNRDSYLHKRIDTTGVLFSNLFRQCYGKLIKDARTLIVRELKMWRSNPNSGQVINNINIHRFFKQNVIESGLRYALSTGNWGVKSVGSFQNIRQGVAQVLNRMSYLSTLSHLRRINTPMEKNGKLVQPRKLENTQFGIICPAECFDPNTDILMWDGTIKKARDINVGDFLIDDNGNSIRVKSTCSGMKTMYDIIPTKKNFMSYTVTDNHILTLKVRKYKEFSWFDKKELTEEEIQSLESTIDDDIIIDITIEKYLSLPKYVQDNMYTFKSSGINWESKPVALDPYILGMWLGDGLSCDYEMVTENILQAVNNKHIPLDYIVNDRKTRLAVLAGIIDANGSVSQNGHEIRITQEEKNYQVIYDTEFLARSLGFSCSTVSDPQRPYKELTITGEYLYEIPTVLPKNKLTKHTPTTRKMCSSFLQSSFKLIKKDIQPFVGWQVEGTGRFLLGDMSVVHNTPEGAAVGLVKNMSMTASITINISSVYVRKVVEELGTCMFHDDIPDISEYLKQMGDRNNVSVIINGDIVGFHVDPHTIYTKLKHYKRYGVIPPTTSIVWEIKKSYILISTEAGRMIRPLLIVDNNSSLRIADPKLQEQFKDLPFQKLLAPLIDNETEGVVELMDVEELDKAMIAMFNSDLKRGIKGTSLPPYFTHRELHPSLLSGVLAANIPFMDHNQAPRNCYQCLWIEEPVLMADGSKLAIQDVKVGDEVVCFDTVNMTTTKTKVINQYVRPTDKPIKRITLMTGRTITLTQDHKIMTYNGASNNFHWKDTTTMDLQLDKIGVYSDHFDLYCEYVKYKRFVGNSDECISETKFTESIIIKGDLFFIPIKSIIDCENCLISDITVESDFHSFIGGDGFAVSNSAMGKQAVGIYMSNFNNRFDTLGHILHYPQKRIVQTRVAKYTFSDELPSAVNAIVAIATHTGFNQEDSVMINQAALDRGFMASTYYKSYRDQCNKNHSTGQEEFFTKPGVTNANNFNYSKLDDNGFIPKDTYVDSSDILVGKVMPQKVHGAIQNRDVSLSIKGNDEGHIDKIHVGVNGDGYKYCKIRLRKYRKPVIGDKVASAAAQKGSIGMIYKHQDMPFTKDGIVPDIIMNPHAIPSRMTIGQLMECIMAKAGCHIGARGDATPFTKCSIEDIASVLQESGYEKYGNEILYCGRTGRQIQTEIFIGPTVYQRLKHMAMDKAHCLREDHDVLCRDGWKNITEVTLEDEVAVLMESGTMEYEKPLEVLKFPDFKGEMYHISNQAIDLDVTSNHRMYVNDTDKKLKNYKLLEASKIQGKYVHYKKDCEWFAKEYQFILPQYEDSKPYSVNMDAWLMFFGIWITEGSVSKLRAPNVIIRLQSRSIINISITNALDMLGILYITSNNKITITNDQLYNYLKDFSQGSTVKFLPSWVFELNKEQARKLIHAMELSAKSIYSTYSKKLADQFMQLCIHAGWSGIITKHNSYTSRIPDIYQISKVLYGLSPSVNKHPGQQYEYKYYYEGPVYCLKVSTEVFMVRRNGKAVWTGNSRGNHGPIIMLTRQPAEGRARNGGLRFGEMERDAIVAHGASSFLKERMLDVSDNFRVFVCRLCGLLCTGNPEKNIFKCTKCKNGTDIVQVRIPYAMKLLLQELMSLSVAPRLSV